MGKYVTILSKSRILGVDLLILVTLGTQAEPFTRLLDAREKSNIKDEIIVQAGNTPYTSNKMKIMKFMSYQEMEDLVNKADLIITHGGTGSIVEPLKKGKKIIGCARLQKYDEHVDDHQEELINAFVAKGYILEFKDGDNIEEIIEKLKCKVKQKNYCALCNIFSIFAENLTVTYKKMKLIIREPNHCNKNYSARNTHSKQVRPIFTGFITRIINYVSTNTS